MNQVKLGPDFGIECLPAVLAGLKAFFRGVPVYYIVWLDERGTYARVRIG